jgi:acyl dehydratase
VTPAQRPGVLIPGSEYAAVVVENLSRAQIVQYAGASGDCSPQHVDEEYARRVGGYPTVFAHGMLTMAAARHLVTDLVGDGKVVTFGMRFLRQVWPGDSLTAQAYVEEPDGDRPGQFVRLTLTVMRRGATSSAPSPRNLGPLCPARRGRTGRNRRCTA